MLSCLLVSYENPLQAANFTVRYRLLSPWQLVWSPLPIDINLTAHTFTYMLIWDSFIIYMSCPLNFPEPLPHTSLPVFGSTSVSLILPTIQARPVMEWKYKSRFPTRAPFPSGLSRQGQYWPHFSTRDGCVTQVRGRQPNGYVMATEKGTEPGWNHIFPRISLPRVWGKVLLFSSEILSPNVHKCMPHWTPSPIGKSCLV